MHDIKDQVKKEFVVHCGHGHCLSILKLCVTPLVTQDILIISL